MDRLPDKDFPPAENRWAAFQPQKVKSPGARFPAIEQSIMDKMEAVWQCRSKSGTCPSTIAVLRPAYNDAFIIDDATKRRLLAADPKSAKIIKPVLRGRDIQRYRTQWAGLWLITTFPSLQLNIDNYPLVKKHLLSFGKDRLEQSGKTLSGGGKSRKKTGNKWFEAQDQIAYHEEFAKEKLFWADLTANIGRFAYSDKEMLLQQQRRMRF